MKASALSELAQYTAKMLESADVGVRKGPAEDVFMKQAEGHTGSRVVVATTAMLSFISFWRAAAIVLNDLGSSAYYVGASPNTRSGSRLRGSFWESCFSPWRYEAFISKARFCLSAGVFIEW